MLPALLLAACNSGGGANIPGDMDSNEPFAGVSEDEVLRFTGTEPFWNGQVQGTRLTYSTPENIDGQTITVERFAGRNGVSFSGELNGSRFDMAVSAAECSDGMSDRTYPFNVTLQVEGEMRSGCAWSESNPYTGPESP